MTSKRRIALPKAVASRFAHVDYFDVSTDGECIILRPLQKSRTNDVRAKLTELGVDEQDGTDAVNRPGNQRNGRVSAAEHMRIAGDEG